MLYIYDMAEQKEDKRAYKQYEYSNATQALQFPDQRIEALRKALGKTKPLITLVNVGTLQSDANISGLKITYKQADDLFEVTKIEEDVTDK